MSNEETPDVGQSRPTVKSPVQIRWYLSAPGLCAQYVDADSPAIARAYYSLSTGAGYHVLPKPLPPRTACDYSRTAGFIAPRPECFNHGVIIGTDKPTTKSQSMALLVAIQSNACAMVSLLWIMPPSSNS